jgi:hypothetical protein
MESVERLVGCPLPCRSMSAGERNCGQMGTKREQTAKAFAAVARLPARCSRTAADRRLKFVGERRVASGLSFAVQFNKCQ